MSELTDFCMPALGADMERGTLLEWRVKPGDEVHRGQIVAEVDTAKSAIEIEVFDDGVIDEILVPPGREVPVGAVLARLRPSRARKRPARGRAAGRANGADAAPRVSPVLRRLARDRGVDVEHVRGSGPGGDITRADIEAAAPPKTQGSPARAVAVERVGSLGPLEQGESKPLVELARAAEPGRAAEPRRAVEPGLAAGPGHAAEPAVARLRGPEGRYVRSSPIARRRAAEAGLELDQIAGTGPAGAVILADVERAMGARAPAPTGRAAKQAAMREAIGALMSRSKREIPHYYLSATMDLEPALVWLERHNADRPPAERVLPIALVLRATALAARLHREFNGHVVDGVFRPAEAVRLGVPVSLRGGGLVTPVIDSAETLTVDELNERLRSVATRAKSGRLRGSELGDPSLTVTNLGDRGVDAVFGVIFPPQVALVGVGSIVSRPWAVDGLLGVRRVITLTLSADHRVSDGHAGAAFLNSIIDRLDHPEEL